MVVGDFPVEVDTLVVGAGQEAMLQQFVQHSWDKRLQLLTKVN